MDYDLVEYVTEFNVCRVGQQFALPPWPIAEAELKFAVRSFNSGPLIDSGEGSVAFVCIVCDVSFSGETQI